MAYGLAVLTSAGFESVSDIYSARVRTTFNIDVPAPGAGAGQGYTTGDRLNWSYASLGIAQGDTYEYDPTKDVWFVGDRYALGSTTDPRWTVAYIETGLVLPFPLVPFSNFFFFDHSNARCSLIFDYGSSTTRAWASGTLRAVIHILRVKA